jgi:transmembrane sensor
MTSASAPEREALRAAAARWLMLRRSGEMTPADERAFHAWLDETPDHQDAWLRMERVWALTGAVAEDPEIAAARAEDQRRFALRPSWRRIAGIARIAAAMLIVLTSTWAVRDSGLVGDFGHERVAQAQNFRTGLGQRTTVTLDDGSVVTLDTDSEVRVLAMARTRTLALTRGRAFFKVAKDATRPFLVHAGDKTVRALGTSFGVRLDKGEVIVTLVEGRVRVEEPRTFLKPGHSAEMTAGAELVAGPDDDWSVDRVDTTRATSWLDGRLTFMRDPLADAVEEMNRYSERKLVFTDGRAPDQQIVGVFKMGDVESFAQAVELNGFARIVSNTPERIELTAE